MSLLVSSHFLISQSSPSSPLVAECTLHKTRLSIDHSSSASSRSCCAGFTPLSLMQGYFLAAHTQIDDSDVAAVMELNRQALRMKALFARAGAGSVDEKGAVEDVEDAEALEQAAMQVRGRRRRRVEHIAMLVVALLLFLLFR